MARRKSRIAMARRRCPAAWLLDMPARPSSTKLQTVLAPLFLALSLVAGRASDDRGFAVLGFGNKSCGTYVEARSERYGDSDYRGWLTGYLSARNGRFNGFYDLLEGTDLSGAMLWLENYCQSHPTEDFYRAAEALEWGRLRGLVQLQPESSTEPWEEEKGKPQDAPGHAGTPKDEEWPGTPTLQDAPAPGHPTGATTTGATTQRLINERSSDLLPSPRTLTSTTSSVSPPPSLFRPRQGLPAHRETHSRMRKHGFTNGSNASGTRPRMILGSNGRNIAQAARSGTLCSRSRPASRKSTYLKTCLPPFGRGSRWPTQQTSFIIERSRGNTIGSGLEVN